MVKRGATEDVLNSEFYKVDFLENREKLRNCNFGLIKLGRLCSKITKGATPNYESQGISFVKSENILQNELDIEDTDFISKEVHELMKRSQLQKNDVLFNIVGASIGRSCIFNVDKQANINQAVCLIRLNSPDYSPEWLSIILNSNHYQIWINQLKSGGARDNIDLNQVNNFEIPKHPVDIQKKIVVVNNQAYDTKRQKKAEANALLDSIDDFLLESLGIILPEKAETKPVFYTRFKNLQGKRFDPFYYDLRFNTFENSVRQGKFTVKNLDSLCIFVASGKTPPKSEYSDEITDYPIIKASSYTGDSINLNKTDFVKSKHSNIEVQLNDIFILAAAHQAEYVGKKVYILEDLPLRPTSYVGELLGIRANKDICNAHYLFSLLKSDLFLKLLNREKRGQTSHLYPHDVKKIQIPLPPLSTQNEIAKHIRGIRAKAKALENESKEILEKAKIEIEKMILGK